MEFLGPCEVCGKVSRSYRSLSQHFRHNQDKDHTELQARYRAWKDSYRAVLRCWKCGQTWETTEKARRNEKNCPRCRKRKAELGKRAYEALSFDKAPDPRPQTTTPSRWRGAPSELRFTPEDPLFGQILRAVPQVGVKKTAMELGVPYQEVRRICVSGWGEDGYQELMSETRQKNVERAAVTRRAFWANLSPEERAERIARWHQKGLNGLESSFWTQLQKGGLSSEDVRFHVWKTVPLGDVKEPREADFSISVKDGKVLVFCDGEAFHGPTRIFKDATEKMQDDVQTSVGFLSMGYSVLRYSETEIKAGMASDHCLRVVGEMQKAGSHIYRTWCPPTEERL